MASDKGRSVKVALAAADQLALQRLGNAVRSSVSAQERALAVTRAVLVCRTHRESGVEWTAMSRALGVSDSTLRRWRRLDHVVKPETGHLAAPLTRTDRVVSAGRVDNRSSELALPSSESRLSAYSAAESNQASTASISAWSLADANAIAPIDIRTPSGAEPASEAVLILTGDPRTGSNHFDLEVGTIRRALLPGLFTSRHLAVIELGEIASAIDRARPTVLHISAHCGLGGVALTSSGREHFVDPVELAEAIGRADHQPSCVVLGFCRSAAIAPRVARTVSNVISWRAEVTDEQEASFVGEFYRQVTMRVHLKRAFSEGRAQVTSRWGVSPTLHARGDGPLF